MNGFDDFDTKQTAEEVYLAEGFHPDTVAEMIRQDEEAAARRKRDESLMGGYYHGPSNSPGLTAREYWESRYEWEDEQERLRGEW